MHLLGEPSIIEQILRWIVRAAVWRAVWSSSPVIVCIGALAAVAGWWGLSRRRARK